MDIVTGLLSSASMWCLLVFWIVNYIFEKTHKEKYIGYDQFVFRDFTMRRYCFAVLLLALGVIRIFLADEYAVIFILIIAYALVKEFKYNGSYLVTKDSSVMHKIESGVVVN
ncbi:hypothetical protein N1030_16340 [Desulfovibrio mangrovi]|uniref:hypothetical protein n=1 Tax=Desulfovibrio mangrovi TaxID=2976983 RepID=UPI002247B90C|nr:hypothetical protein [Desulfovibrio mangrovi]UZP67146.1 hypothetical protein N1030_16340 [Desulfovibrio mangrovi]